jgi:hypothetical protein
LGGDLIKNSDLIRGILEDACGRHEFLILVTPYLRYESHFLGMEGNAVHVSATMSREDALYALKNADLKFRFPNGTSFLEGQTRMLGLGLVENRKSLKLSIPREFSEGDQRGAYRVERVGRISATLSTSHFDLWTASLVDISLTGARLLAPRDLTAEQLKPPDGVTVSIPLTEDIHINSGAIVRHVDARNFGISFDPPLEDPIKSALARWAFQRREEDQDRISRKGSVPGAAAVAKGPGVKGLLLVSASEGLETELKEVLKEVQPLFRAAQNVQGLREGLASSPTLVFFHVTGLTLDDRRRLKALIEAAAGRVPFMLLGAPGIEMSPLLELGTEMKAAATYQWGPGKGAFFQRLVQGILRRHYEDREGPLAPRTEEA